MSLERMDREAPSPRCGPPYHHRSREPTPSSEGGGRRMHWGLGDEQECLWNAWTGRPPLPAAVLPIITARVSPLHLQKEAYDGCTGGWVMSKNVSGTHGQGGPLSPLRSSLSSPLA